MEEKREERRVINKIELAGKIEQMSFNPETRRYDWGIIDYTENPRYSKEVMISFPASLYIQENMVGRYMAIEGVLSTDKDGDTIVIVQSIVPCTARKTRCKYKPEWWNGPMNIPGYSSFVPQKEGEELCQIGTV